MTRSRCAIPGLAGLATAALLVGWTPAAAQAPGELTIAAILSAGLEHAWDKALVDSINAVAAEKPHGAEIKLVYTEGVWGDEAEQAMRVYAEGGEADIIFANSSYADQVENLKDEFPDIMWVVNGSGNRALGGNAYLVYYHGHEPAYLMGLLAGSLTKSNVIGTVGLFPADDVNDQVNAYVAGARSVNSEVQAKVTFIESWYDPAKAREAANAQIAAGADFIYQLGESFEACVEKKVICFGNYIDYNAIAPEVVMTSALVHWEPTIRYLVDEWHKHATTGAPYAAPTEAVWFSMAEGGSSLAPYHNHAAAIPAEVKAKVEEAKAAILAGSLEVPMVLDVPKSD
jgi:basic membrane lipoprotein Med (substrate-binding protein (PBP1-ABC) superfamily)